MDTLDYGLSSPQLARRAYASFATAWQVKRDWELLGAGAADDVDDVAVHEDPRQLGGGVGLEQVRARGGSFRGA